MEAVSKGFRLPGRSAQAPVERSGPGGRAGRAASAFMVRVPSSCARRPPVLLRWFSHPQVMEHCPAQPAPPTPARRPSLLMWGAAGRVAAAALLLGGLWAAVGWALRG